MIILTSNLGSQYLANLEEGQDVESVEPQVMEVVRGHFRPEFLNRLDEIILFHRLGVEHMAPIVEIQVGRVQSLLKDRKIVLELTDPAKRWLGGLATIRSMVRGRSSGLCSVTCRTRWPKSCLAGDPRRLDGQDR